jgi:hypothetical protein
MKPLADDILTGAGQIAAYIGWPKRRVFYLLEGGQLPAFKIGSRWCARRTTLTNHIEKLERAVDRGALIRSAKDD